MVTVFEAMGVSDPLLDGQVKEDTILIFKKLLTEPGYFQSHAVLDLLQLYGFSNTPENRKLAAVFFVLGQSLNNIDVGFKEYLKNVLSNIE